MSFSSGGGKERDEEGRSRDQREGEEWGKSEREMKRSDGEEKWTGRRNKGRGMRKRRKKKREGEGWGKRRKDEREGKEEKGRGRMGKEEEG